MEQSPATLTMNGDVAVVTMDDGKVNAASHQMLEALEKAVDEAERSSKALVLVGREGTFCAGFDLKVMRGAEPEAMIELSARGGRLVHRLYGLRMPVVMAATGHAVALGAVLLLAADVRVGPDADYKFGLNETAIGMTLPRFATAPAQDRLNPAHLTAAVVAARIYDAPGAVEAGFLDMLAAEHEVAETAIATAQQLAQLPGATYGANKHTIRGASLAEIAESLGI